MKETHTLVIGASISGLATAACLQKQGIDYTIIEKQDRVAAPWHQHYDRLHLHTSKRYSNLPYKKFGGGIPRYPGRQQVIDYLEDYRAAFNIQPLFHTTAISIKKDGNHWLTNTDQGFFHSKYIVMATGCYGRPRPIEWAGMETFPGKILHSYGYKTGAAFKGQNVLVAGFGNSACEIAIDLYEQGARPFMAVRSPVNIVPRDMLGIPILALSLALSPLPPRVADALSAPLVRWLIGDIGRLGLQKKPYGPLEEIHKDGKAPVLDIGTIRHIRAGHIGVRGDIDRIDGSTVYFSNGKSQSFDAIIAAIGYYRDYADIVDTDKSRFDDLRLPAGKQQYFGRDGLYFCGYRVSPTGQIREIGMDARKIARDIARKESGRTM